MTQDEISIVEWAFKGLVSIILSIGAWLWVMLVGAVRDAQKELDAHKLNVSENYARKTDIRDVFTAINEIQKDIKTLLGRHL